MPDLQFYHYVNTIKSRWRRVKQVKTVSDLKTVADLKADAASERDSTDCVQIFPLDIW